MKMYAIAALLCSICIITAASPAKAHAAIWSSPFEVSGWIPYWRATNGTTEAVLHMSQLKEVNPFGYSVKKDGTLSDTIKINQGTWPLLRTLAKKNNVRFIPSIMWSDTEAIHTVLSDPKKRLAHINQITQMVKANGYDGVDIDYEAKKAETRPYFSLFLKELYKAMGDKWVMCTIESRTPPEDRFKNIPPDLEYSNDFKEINKYCDRVRIMAYDQERVDLSLNAVTADPYIPVADIRWVEKVLTVAMKDIDKKKLVLGIPTYGYAWDMFQTDDPLAPAPQAFIDGMVAAAAMATLTSSSSTTPHMSYSKLWAFNPRYATETIAPKLGLTPQRNAGGEMFIMYQASREPDPTSAVPMPNAIRVMTWNDAQAIADKVALAKKLGIRGVAIFKLDGGADQGMWNALK